MHEPEWILHNFERGFRWQRRFAVHRVRPCNDVALHRWGPVTALRCTSVGIRNGVTLYRFVVATVLFSVTYLFDSDALAGAVIPR